MRLQHMKTTRNSSTPLQGPVRSRRPSLSLFFFCNFLTIGSPTFLFHSGLTNFFPLFRRRCQLWHFHTRTKIDLVLEHIRFPLSLFRSCFLPSNVVARRATLSPFQVSQAGSCRNRCWWISVVYKSFLRQVSATSETPSFYARLTPLGQSVCFVTPFFLMSFLVSGKGIHRIHWHSITHCEWAFLDLSLSLGT